MDGPGGRRKQAEVTELSDGLRTLLARSIDYAGLLPPAGLPMAEALKDFARYRRQSDSWMLGRFVCPVKQLSEMSAQEKLWRDRKTHVAVLGTAVADMGQLMNHLDDDLQSIVDFLEAHGNDAQIDALEMSLPAVESETAIESVASFASAAGKALDAANLSEMDVFLEFTSDQDWELSVTGLLRAIEMTDLNRIGIKIRLAGRADNEMPSADQLAFFVNACRSLGVRWKAAGALHDPLPQTESNGNTQFGFLNVFAAAVLGSVHRLTQSQVTSILMETSVSEFRFDQEAFSWGGFRANLPGIEQGRRQSVCSLSSCSFDEPLDGLRKIGLIAS